MIKHIKIIVMSLLLLPLLALAEVPANLENTHQQSSIATMLKTVMPGVVNIYAEGDTKGSDNPFAAGEHDQGAQSSSNSPRHFVSIGSGVIVDAKKGYILTNAHVVYEADNMTVTLNDGRRFKAQIIGADTGFDIALLQIHAKNLTAIPLGNSSNLEVGDFVTAIGSPFNLKQTVTSGIVSALHRSIHIEGNEDFIQTDAAINIGSSGGALVNLQGKLVGINTAILAPDGGNIGIGFAIPINLAHHVMEDILKYGKLHRGLLGVLIQNLTPDLAQSFASPINQGALISQVNPDSAAAKAGLKDGDIITSVNGTRVDNSSEVRNKVSLLRPETSVELGIVREGEKMNIRAQVMSQKQFKENRLAREDSPLAGVSLGNFNQQTLNYGHVKGAQVIYVDQNSDAWASMLRPGDVIVAANHHKVTDINSLEQIVQENPNRLLLHVMRDNGAFYLVIP